MSKPSIPQGTRDFSPEEVRKRQYILNTLKKIFRQYGFQPLETPAMENLTTLTGKYGEEGDRLIFKILNNGLHEKKDSDKEKLNEEWSKLLSKPYTTPVVTERALRYDLTIPFARFVAMRHNDIAFPFKRYQMQPVWRADRPQKGRYREFWQCDCDVVGSTSLINEAELLCIYREAFHKLKLKEVTVKINSRKLLAAIATLCNAPEKMGDITVALDKLDKVGWDGVTKELVERGIDQTGIDKIAQVVNINGNNEDKLDSLQRIFRLDKDTTKIFLDTDGKEYTALEMAERGIAELKQTLHFHKQLQKQVWKSQLVIDISLARGLNYYTGIIMEVTTSVVKIGSIGGGGRYDNLTGLFGLNNMSGVGISFGIDRIYDVLEESGGFPPKISSGTTVLLLNEIENSQTFALKVLTKLRNSNVLAEIYPDVSKFDKQMKYANKRNIPYVIILREDELAASKVSLKNLDTGEQYFVTVDEAIKKLKTK